MLDGKRRLKSMKAWKTAPLSTAVLELNVQQFEWEKKKIIASPKWLPTNTSTSASAKTCCAHFFLSAWLNHIFWPSIMQRHSLHLHWFVPPNGLLRPPPPIQHGLDFCSNLIQMSMTAVRARSRGKESNKVERAWVCKSPLWGELLRTQNRNSDPSRSNKWTLTVWDPLQLCGLVWHCL